MSFLDHQQMYISRNIPRPGEDRINYPQTDEASAIAHDELDHEEDEFLQIGEKPKSSSALIHEAFNRGIMATLRPNSDESPFLSALTAKFDVPGLGRFCFSSHAPAAFRKLRKLFIDEKSYFKSLSFSNLEDMHSKGKSGESFFRTADRRLVLKTVATEEMVLGKLDHHIDYFSAFPNSFIAPFLGLYTLQFESKQTGTPKSMHLVCLPNVFYHCTHSTPSLDLGEPNFPRRYDLKGCHSGRAASAKEQKSGFVVYQDNDLGLHRQRIWVGYATRSAILEQFKQDCLFLEQLQIVDYSLLLGVAAVEPEWTEIGSVWYPTGQGPATPLTGWPPEFSARHFLESAVESKACLRTSIGVRLIRADLPKLDGVTSPLDIYFDDSYGPASAPASANGSRSKVNLTPVKSNPAGKEPTILSPQPILSSMPSLPSGHSSQGPGNGHPVPLDSQSSLVLPLQGVRRNSTNSQVGATAPSRARSSSGNAILNTTQGLDPVGLNRSVSARLEGNKTYATSTNLPEDREGTSSRPLPSSLFGDDIPEDDQPDTNTYSISRSGTLIRLSNQQHGNSDEKEERPPGRTDGKVEEDPAERLFSDRPSPLPAPSPVDSEAEDFDKDRDKERDLQAEDPTLDEAATLIERWPQQFYYLAIVDTLQPYNNLKRAESTFKSLYKDPTILPPQDYSQRLQLSVEKVVGINNRDIHYRHDLRVRLIKRDKARKRRAERELALRIAEEAERRRDEDRKRQRDVESQKREEVAKIEEEETARWNKFLRETKVDWMPDAAATSCASCSHKFNVLNRKHHCRLCGRVVCKDCIVASSTVQIPNGIAEGDNQTNGRVRKGSGAENVALICRQSTPCSTFREESLRAKYEKLYGDQVQQQEPSISQPVARKLTNPQDIPTTSIATTNSSIVTTNTSKTATTLTTNTTTTTTAATATVTATTTVTTTATATTTTTTTTATTTTTTTTATSTTTATATSTTTMNTALLATSVHPLGGQKSSKAPSKVQDQVAKFSSPGTHSRRKSSSHKRGKRSTGSTTISDSTRNPDGSNPSNSKPATSPSLTSPLPVTHGNSFNKSNVISQ